MFPRGLVSVLALGTQCALAQYVASPDDSLGALTSYNFTADKSIVAYVSGATECMGSFPYSFPGSTVGQVAILNSKDPTYLVCYAGAYTNDATPVSNGTLIGSDGTKLEAYLISPALKPAAMWAQSKQMLYYKALQSGNITVYSFDGTVFKALTTVYGNSSQYVKLADVSGISRPTIYVVAPSSQLVSSFPQLSSTGEGGLASSGASPIFRFTARRFKVGGRPYVPEVDFNQGSGCHDFQKMFFPTSRADGSEGVVYQDKVSNDINMVWFSRDLTSASTTTLMQTSLVLAGAVSDGDSKIALVVVSSQAAASKSGEMPVTAYMFSSSTGQQLLSADLPTGNKSAPNWLNHYKYQPYGASMVWSTQKGVIGFLYAQLLTVSSDGLNHQASTGIVLDGTTLKTLKAYGLVSSHSFGNTNSLDSAGNFLSMDLGDNYPRGINMHNWNATWFKSRTVYSYKTYHMTSSGGFPLWPEISTPGGTQFYKWSNDNNVYTELAHPGILEAADGFLAFFASERPSLDNSKCSGKAFNMARNIGYVKVPKDLTNATGILSKGTPEMGGFYDYWGNWNPQWNNGTVWLTNYTDPLNSVSRLRALKLNSTAIVLLWELWGNITGSYNKTQFMVVDWDGNVLLQATDLGAPLNLGRGEEPFLKNGRLVAYSGTPSGQIMRVELCLFVCSSPPTTTPPAGATVTTAPQPTTIQGSMKLAVANPANYVNDNAFKTGVTNALARSLGGIPAAWISITLSVARRLLEGIGRQLQSSILVSYTIIVPSGSSGTQSAAALTQTLSAATTAAFNPVLTDELAKAGSSANATVSSFGSVQVLQASTDGTKRQAC